MDETRRVAGILLCAGSAQRMGFDKLQTPLAGKTAIQRSMEALVAGGVTELVFAVNDGTRAFVEQLRCPLPRRIVRGGDTRQQSVQNALRAADCHIAVIHDAARCFVSPQIVRRSIESAIRYGSGVVALPVTDTVLRQDEAGGVAVVPREHLYRMQTPQTFRRELILDALARALADGAALTDDCAAAERVGAVVTATHGSYRNIKVTTPEDITAAEALLEQEE